MPNWKQELQLEIAGVEDVNRNTAILICRINDLGGFLGGEDKIIEFRRELVVRAPEPVRAGLVDGLNYRAGDFLCRAAFLRVKAAHDPQPDDPEIIVNRVVKTLAEVRPFTAARDWGIDLGDDALAIGGDVWNITGVKGDQWLDNEPALLEFTLRK